MGEPASKQGARRRIHESYYSLHALYVAPESNVLQPRHLSLERAHTFTSSQVPREQLPILTERHGEVGVWGQGDAHDGNIVSLQHVAALSRRKKQKKRTRTRENDPEKKKR